MAFLQAALFVLLAFPLFLFLVCPSPAIVVRSLALRLLSLVCCFSRIVVQTYTMGLRSIFMLFALPFKLAGAYESVHALHRAKS